MAKMFAVNFPSPKLNTNLSLNKKYKIAGVRGAHLGMQCYNGGLLRELSRKREEAVEDEDKFGKEEKLVVTGLKEGD